MKYILRCEDCGAKKAYEARSVRSVLEAGRGDGWVINRDNTRQWCPNCAYLHRRPGKRGNKKRKENARLDG